MIINLLPWRERDNKRKNQRFIGQLIAMSIISIGLLCGLYQHIYRIKFKQTQAVSRLNHLLSDQGHLEDIQAIESMYRNLSEQIEKVHDIKKHQTDFWNRLATLKKARPNNLQLKQLSWKNQQITIIGEADQAETVTHLVNQLKNDSFFKTLSISTLTQIDQGAGVRFSITTHQSLSTTS